MPRENVDIVRRGYAQFEAGDFEGASQLFAADAEIPDIAGLGATDAHVGTRRGPEGFLRIVAETLDAFEDYRIEAEEFVDAGDAVLVSVRISGRGRGSGASLETRLVHLWVMRDGKGVRGEVYRSMDQALQAAGLSESQK